VIGKKQQNNRTKDFIVDTEKRGREGPLFFVVCGPPGGLWKYWDCLKILIVVKRKQDRDLNFSNLCAIHKGLGETS
jgi:hypothetical protein